MTLKDRLERYLRTQNRWIPKGELLRLVAKYTTYTSENAGRRLRELESDGLIEVSYIKNHAHYRTKQTMEQWFNDLPTPEASVNKVVE